MFRIRGFLVGLYFRNISNENLGTSSMFALRGRFEAVKANITTRMRLIAINYQDLFVFSQDIAHEHS